MTNQTTCEIQVKSLNCSESTPSTETNFIAIVKEDGGVLFSLFTINWKQIVWQITYTKMNKYSLLIRVKQACGLLVVQFGLSAFTHVYFSRYRKPLRHRVLWRARVSRVTGTFSPPSILGCLFDERWSGFIWNPPQFPLVFGGNWIERYALSTGDRVSAGVIFPSLVNCGTIEMWCNWNSLIRVGCWIQVRVNWWCF